MNITSQNNQPHFTSINQIMIAKKAFNKPEDLIAVEKTFKDELITIIGKPKAPKALRIIKGLLGMKTGTKAKSFLEQPDYVNIYKKLNKPGMGGFDWISQRLGIPIDKPVNENYHTFFVYTNKEKDAIMKSFSGVMKEYLKKTRQLRNDKTISTNDSNLWIKVQINQMLNNVLKPIMEKSPPIITKVENLSELPAVLKNIDY